MTIVNTAVEVTMGVVAAAMAGVPGSTLAEEIAGTPWSVENYDLFMAFAEVVKVLFVMAFGACVGSLTNVLVYRLPLGLDVVRPQSRCPMCGTLLTWRENIPILGWLLLRGRCRFCRSPISAEYPLVEAFVAVLFAVVYLTLYSENGRFFGVPFYLIQPEWAGNGFALTWPAFIVVLILFSSLVAMTLVDAKTFTIPMVLTTVPVVVAVVAHPLHAIWVETRTATGRLWSIEDGWTWTIATPGAHGWWWVGGSVGGVVGLLVSNGLLRARVIRPSFEDYAEWERGHLAKVEAAAQGDVGGESASTATTGGGGGEGGRGADSGGRGEGEGDGGQRDISAPELWAAYPHARREMAREALFLAPVIGLGLLGAAIAYYAAGPWTFDPMTLRTLPAIDVPLWLDVVAGVFMGYLVGGGVVWAVRIAGSLAFGKEAMGLGDVHMMAAVGACLGWTDAVLGFFGAAFVGLAYAGIAGLRRGWAPSLPYGPHLAVATVLVWLFKPVVEWGLTRLSDGVWPVRLP
jgi:leader peptidase (prepilin peptidase)/N-methyltransferase